MPLTIRRLIKFRIDYPGAPPRQYSGGFCAGTPPLLLLQHHPSSSRHFSLSTGTFRLLLSFQPPRPGHFEKRSSVSTPQPPQPSSNHCCYTQCYLTVRNSSIAHLPAARLLLPRLNRQSGCTIVLQGFKERGSIVSEERKPSTRRLACTSPFLFV